MRNALAYAKGHDLDLKRTEKGWSATLQRRFMGMFLVGEPFSGTGQSPYLAVLTAFANKRSLK